MAKILNLLQEEHQKSFEEETYPAKQNTKKHRNGGTKTNRDRRDRDKLNEKLKEY